jgi:ABC-type amino acid transport substrate-binding protein
VIAMLLAVAAAATTPAPVRCGAVERPGIAERGGDGVWRGVAVELCRRYAQARDGNDAAIAFHPYRRTEDLRDAPNDAVTVLSAAEMALAWPGAGQPPIPPVAISRQVLLVHPGTPLHSRSELGGRRVCFIIATAAEAALNGWAGPARIGIQRVGFQEAVELRDAFDAGYCAAMAVDAQDIPGGAERTVELGPALVELPMFVVMRHGSGR